MSSVDNPTSPSLEAFVGLDVSLLRTWAPFFPIAQRPSKGSSCTDVTPVHCRRSCEVAALQSTMKNVVLYC